MSSNVRRAVLRPQLRDLLLALYPLGLVLLTIVALIMPQRTGALALGQVLAQLLFLPTLLLVPFALRRGRFLLRLALATAAATFWLVYPPALRLGGTAPPPAAPQLTLLQWNLYVGGVAPAQLRQTLDRYQPDVVTFQESDWELIADDRAIMAAYPYRLLRPEETAPGLAVLSRLPILASGVPDRDEPGWDMPRLVWARLELEGRTLTLVNAHPIPPRTFDERCARPGCYNTGPRDAQIVDMRRFIVELRQRTGDPLILAGDMNMTEREPIYFELTAGLRDAHRAVGSGFGATWRPGGELPVGLIRIDYLFTDARLQPVSLRTDCAPRGSDHCLLVGRFAVEDGAPERWGEG